MPNRPIRFARLAGLAAAAALSAGTLAAASLAHAQIRGDFDQADANHDSRVTLQEFQAYATQQLTSRSGPMAQRFKQLSPDKQTALVKRRFDKADSSHKGYLTRQDWAGS